MSIKCSKEYSAGAVIIKKISSKKYILLAEHLENTFSFPKGHIDKGETPRQAVAREVGEETGYIHFSIGKVLGSIKRSRIGNNNELVEKHITMFEVDLVDEERSKVYDEACQWVDVTLAVNSMRYEEDSEFLKNYFTSIG
jgi:bis(5'-nucleosidyl)-tetraphosphatase